VGSSVIGIGKGIVTSSIGALLKACNLRVTAIKIDPYINIDAGTFSPYEHGEVFVLDDGCEVDLDLGNYERFLDIHLSSSNNITTGKIYQLVINRERAGDYLGKTVQIVPHITDAIQQWIEGAARGDDPGQEPEVCLIELGGTTGDIEGMPFIEALRQLQRRVKKENFCCCHVSLVPCIGTSREFKTKPTQSSVSKLRSYGLHPDMIVCRSEAAINSGAKDKISMFCDVEQDRVFALPDLKTIYGVPSELQEQGIIRALSECLMLKVCACDRMKRWSSISEIALHANEEVSIALVGKYTALGDCYASVVKALEHSCYEQGSKPKIKYIDSELLIDSAENQAWEDLKTSRCLIVPGGFGTRGVAGKMNAIKWARQNKIPFLGVCLGFQLTVIEYARNVTGIADAHSTEFVPEESCDPVVIEMLEYKDPDKKMGGTMRLGLRETKFVAKDSIVRGLYGNVGKIRERHRHRYEINPDYVNELEKSGLRFVGKNEDETRMEILELHSTVHPYFVAVQYHPEYSSRPFCPSPVYAGLIMAAKS